MHFLRSMSVLLALVALQTAEAQTDSIYPAEGPCDVYARGGTPCVAAYSTTRALYSAFAGGLYQVRRSDGKTQDIKPLSAGGVADASVQDAFCAAAGANCRISILYDQSGKGNHLTKAPAGNPTYGLYNDSEAVADALPIRLDGRKVYGVHITPGGWTTPGQVGYRNTATNGIAKGDNPETMYMVADGTYVNGACCFDFGNAEMSSTVYGDMETIYFGTNDWWGKGTGSGPWVMGDLENGVYSMGGVGNYSAYGDKNGAKINSQSVSFPHPFATAYLKGNSATATNGGPYTLKGANAQSGKLTTVWDGPFPVGYSPRNRQGGIVLGIGGDNSSGARGNFYEGVMTTGFASNAVDDAVQANIVAAGYGRTSTVNVPASHADVFNGTFDQGTLGWTFNVWGGGAQGGVAAGEYKVAIDSIGTRNSDIQVVQNGIILEQGKSYQVTFAAWGGVARTLESNVEKDDSPWTSYLDAVRTFDLGTTRKSFSYTFTMTNPTDSNSRVSFNAGASTGAVFLDDIAIREVETPSGIRDFHTPVGAPATVRREGSLLRIGFAAGDEASVAVGLYDLAGHRVRRADARVEGVATSGSWTLDLAGLPHGLYVLGIDLDGAPFHRSGVLLGK